MDTKDLADGLIGWFRREGRDLPWRRRREVYGTVVSEFMLQQTQVKTVLPYYEEWMQRFPGFEALAAAEENAVLSAWAGLGYYRRARNLQRLAKELAARGKIPETAAEWQSLPGVGPYTAAAVASLVFGDPAAVVDGNVVRVYARLLGITEVFRSGAEAIARIRPIAEERLDRGRAGLYNEALMELGATVCTPRAPKCLLCPWSRECQVGLGGGVGADRVPRIERIKAVEVKVRRLLWIREGLVLLKRRGQEKRLEGFWEIPELPKWAGDEWNGAILVRKRGISHQRITEYLHVPGEGELASLEAWLDQVDDGEFEWIAVEGLQSVPIAGPHRRWIEAELSR